MKLWLANFSSQVTDDELRAVMHECEKLEAITRLTREVGYDLQPGAVLEFDEPGRETLCEAQRRLRESYWKHTRGLCADIAGQDELSDRRAPVASRERSK